MNTEYNDTISDENIFKLEDRLQDHEKNVTAC